MSTAGRPVTVEAPDADALRMEAMTHFLPTTTQPDVIDPDTVGGVLDDAAGG